ncbi:MAG: hypothetical protein HW419_721 [Deltaproteobacteria bacterium]|nr:hypothetical protein [Deltaproteobacteria bacterium]
MVLRIFYPLTRIESTKAAPRTEARSSKQIQMTKKYNVSNDADSDSSFWNCSGFDLFGCDLLRILIFGFMHHEMPLLP